MTKKQQTWSIIGGIIAVIAIIVAYIMYTKQKIEKLNQSFTNTLNYLKKQIADVQTLMDGGSTLEEIKEAYPKLAWGVQTIQKASDLGMTIDETAYRGVYWTMYNDKTKGYSQAFVEKNLPKYTPLEA